MTWTGNVAQQFLEYYRGLGYEELPGSSLLHPSVPMSFVMSAGLAQVESSAMLQGGRTGDRYTLLQNCFRYFDLDRIGTSPIHLSLFRMPGAFTFGDWGKQESIAQIWDLLLRVYALPADRLWVSYFAGGKVAGYPFGRDEETYRAWRAVGMPAERIVGLGPEDNFWKQGASVVGEEDVPKCGPNTEVFFDRGPDLACGPQCRPGCGCRRFVEFLNTLFITWHLDDETSVVFPLEEPFTETVVGAERVAMLLQGAASVFDIAGIRPLVEQVRRFARRPPHPIWDQHKYERVLVDHLRALAFLTADHAPRPGKGGRARLMRKLVREVLTSQQVLGIADPEFIPALTAAVLALHAEEHPQLSFVEPRLLGYIQEEQERFERTLKRGRRQLDRLLVQRAGHGGINGEDMLMLEKRHGVPEPLLEIMLAQRQVPFNRQAYRQAYAEWQQTTVGAS